MNSMAEENLKVALLSSKGMGAREAKEKLGEGERRGKARGQKRKD